VKTWKSINPPPVLISTNGMMISQDGLELGLLEKKHDSKNLSMQTGPVNNDFDLLRLPVIGFSLTIDSILYRKFPPISLWMWSEDEIFRTRAMLIGPMVYLPDALVKYRDGGISKASNLTKENYIERLRVQAISRLNYIIQVIIDLNFINGNLCNYEDNYLRKLDFAIKQVRLSNGGNFFYDCYLLLLFLTNRRVKLKITKRECIAMFGINHMPSIFFSLKKLKINLWKILKKK
jgi:hypothetical protein